MSAARCPVCLTDWPSGFKDCPECERPTVFNSKATAINYDDAKSRRSAALFNSEYWEKYDQGLPSKCGPGHKGPTPEERDRIERAPMMRELDEIRSLPESCEQPS